MDFQELRREVLEAAKRNAALWGWATRSRGWCSMKLRGSIAVAPFSPVDITLQQVKF